ncbi:MULTISPECIES: DsbA family protein [Corynebacterium]|uniref:Thioredoxin-like fold domain-containing protein n=1 Tax=Corynebacterium hadale TaxID=2026255 RepID=A0A269PFZ2_9CORY|nr:MULTISPECIES: thioredoxin domain-containing protein [Corynebacterium]MCG7253998.1 DsbA family protein [Corynebacterium hadale]MCG7257280.1 DsbA family protein [Corynebacterium hadale]MCG7266081.1 DsbA family protein [Corynebacterium hadale]PAJ70888.1 hypothetical protein CIG21_01485 [Corynebacterium hadale]TVX75795.1 hypothetical protein FPP74_12020 [Corynebacterium sp. NML180780]
MTTRKVQNPNAKGGAGFIWAIVAVIAIAAIVIGIIVFNGKKDRKDAIAEEMIDTTGITSTWEEGSDVIHLAAEGAEDAPEADLFEDFSCSHCAELEEATGDQALEALKAGEIQIELRPMVALDGRGDAYSPDHSTRTLAAELALFAHNDTNAALNLRYYLFGNQQDVYKKLEAEDLAKLAEDYGASGDAVQEIRDGKYMDTAKEVSDANIKLQEERTKDAPPEQRGAWTPRVMVDGKDIEGGRDAWVETLKNSK